VKEKLKKYKLYNGKSKHMKWEKTAYTYNIYNLFFACDTHTYTYTHNDPT